MRTRHDDQGDRPTPLSKLGILSVVLGVLACASYFSPLTGVRGGQLAQAGILIGLIGLAAALGSGRSGEALPAVGIAVCILGLMFARHAPSPACAEVEDDRPPAATAPAGAPAIPAEPAPPSRGAALRRARLFTVDALGAEPAKAGSTGLRFRIANRTGRSLDGFRGSILIFDRLGEPLLALWVQYDKPVGAGGQVDHCGVWPIAAATLRRLRDEAHSLQFAFIARSVAYQDGTSETFPWPGGRPY